MRPRRRLLRLLAVATALIAHAAEPAAPSPAPASFIYTQAGKHVKVWYYATPGLAADAPVVIVQHGVGRNGEDYLHDWMPHAERERFLLVVPEFSKTEFAGVEGYNYGNTVDQAGRPLPREQWSFNMIEPIFDAMRARTGNRSAAYFIFGHSAGAQFVQRFLYFVPRARVTHAVAANAGWYMLPDLTVAFPYGLKGTPVTADDLRAALARPFTVLLGDADTDPEARSLRHTPESEAQGATRFARGHYFFNYARTAAASLPAPFGWSLATAPGIDHSDKGMAPFAVRILLPSHPTPNKP
jgi:poly(3-hydroxybutyrate) depolymerase